MKGSNKMSTSQVKATERQEAIERLKKIVKPGDTIYTVLRRVSSSGMMRWIDVYKFESVNEGRLNKSWLSYQTAKALGWTFDENRECVKVGGGGMDMGFHLVYSLSRTLFNDNFYCIGKNCPSNDHTNGDVSREDGLKQHYKHSDGGYALNQEWI